MKDILGIVGCLFLKASTIVAEMEKIHPEIISCCKKALEYIKEDLDFKRIDEKIFSDCPSCSIDVELWKN